MSSARTATTVTSRLRLSAGSLSRKRRALTRRSAFLVLPAAILLLSCTLSPLGGAEAAGGAEGPVPVRRIVVPPERVPEEMKLLKLGALVQLPRADFEERLRRAGGAAAPKAAPQLVEARYSAKLDGLALSGSGVWQVAYSGAGPGLLPLQLGAAGSFNLALKQPRFENGEALIAEFDGRGLALRVDGPGERDVTFDWSARAEARPEGLQFDLKVPACPVATLELDASQDRAVTALDGSPVSGPLPAEKPELRRWRVVFSGRPSVTLLVRPAEGPGRPAPLVFARQHTVQSLAPDGLEASFEFSLEVLHQGLRELVCECDPALRPREVLVAGLEGWDVKPGPRPDAPALLTVRLSEPFRGGTLQVNCVAPLGPAPAPAGAFEWACPGVRLAGAVPRGEALDLYVHPDVRLETWQPGGFRLTGAGPAADPQRGGAAHHLALAGGGVGPEGGPPGAPPRRPAARLRTSCAEFRARQLGWWKLGPRGQILTLQIGYEVSQGQLFQLPVLLPEGWEVEAVETAPVTLLRGSSVRHPPGGKGRPTLVVDLQRPLTPERPGAAAVAGRPRTPPALTVRLRPTQAGPVTGRPLPFPDAEPLGARFREGALAVDFDEQLYQATVTPPLARSEADDEVPEGKQAPEHYYRYRGEPPRATLLLQPRPPRLRGKCASEVFVGAGQATVKMRLALEAEVGSLDAVELDLSAPAGTEPWAWAGEADASGQAGADPVRRAERLHPAEVAGGLSALAARDPAQAAALLAARPRGERWRLTLARPLRVREPLVLRATRRLGPAGGRWEVPLPSLPGAARTEGEVTLYLAGADLVQAEAMGLRDGPAGGGAWRSFRYGPGPVALALRGSALAADRSAEAAIDAAALTTWLAADGRLEHHLAFRVANWPQRALPVRLPAGAELVAAQADGRWLPEPALAETAEGEVEVSLPAPGGAGPHRFEVVYATAGPRWALWAEVRAPAPRLPVPPASFRRLWRLPPGARPLTDAGQRRLPGPGEGSPGAAAARGPADLFRLSPHLPPPWPPADTRPEQRQALAEAAVSLRTTREGQLLTLRELVDQVAFAHLKGRPVVVLDTAALREGGLTPETALEVQRPTANDDPALPGEERGLVAVFARAGTLLTTRRQAELWRAESAPAAPLPPALESAVAAAAAAGRDPSGRFRSALDWLRPGAPAEAAAAPLLAPDQARTGWTEWEPLAGEDGDTLLVIRVEFVTAAGLVLAALLALALWRWPRPAGHGRFGFVLLWLALAGLGVLWLPAGLQGLAWWPLLAGCGLALLWFLRSVTRDLAAPPAKARAAGSGVTAAAALAVLIVAGRGGPAAPPAPATPYPVLLLPAPPDAPEKQTVLVPPALLDRLNELTRPAAPAGPGAVLVSAGYDGKLADGAAEFTAVFEAHALADEARLALPLDGVQLFGDVLLDGARTLPAALPAPQAGYALTVAGRGRHKVELHFRVPVAAAGEGRDVRFAVPRLVQSRLVLAVPAGATSVLAQAKHGAQHVPANADGVRLEAELGAVRDLHLSWRQEASPPRPARVKFQEAYLWNLRPDGCTLTALLRYRVEQGAVPSLAVDLPPELEVRAAEARPPARLRDCPVTSEGGRRTLHLEFQAPVSGDAEVSLELVPGAPLPARVRLPLPAPRGQSVAEGHVAYSARGLEDTRQDLLRVTGILPARFAPFWPASSRPDARPPTYAATFRREGGQPPVLGLHLRPAPTPVQAKQDVSLRVGRTQADLQATLELTASAGDLALVECELHSARPLTVARVSGPDVRSWCQSGNRLLVWLEAATAATTLEVAGWLPLAVGPDGEKRLDLPGLRLPAARRTGGTLRVSGAAGLALVPAPGTLRHLQPRAAGPDLTFDVRQGDYAGTVVVRPEGAAARVLTFAEVREGRLTFTTTVDYEVRGGGELRTVQVRLRNWEGEEPKLMMPGEVRRRDRRRAPGDRTWVVDLGPGVRGRYSFQLTCGLPVEEAAAGVAMPDVSVAGGGEQERWLAAAAGDLAAEGAEGLAALADPAALTAARGGPEWAKAAKQAAAGRVWRVQAEGWKLRLLPRERPAGPGAVRVFLAEQTAAVADGRRWLHRAEWWLRHEAHTDLSVALPAAARVLAVSLDGAEVAPVQPGPQRLWLPLPGRAGVRRLAVWWVYDPPEPLDRPNLDRPRLGGVAEGPALWTAYVPPGYRVAGGGARDLGAGEGRAAALDLYRAEAQLHVSEALAEHPREGGGPRPLAAAQQRFYLHWRHAERALRGGAAGVTGGRPLGVWLQELQARNQELARQRVFEKERAEADRQAQKGEAPADGPARAVGPDLPGEGTPRSWGADHGGEAPRPELESEQGRRVRAALAASGQWLGLLAAVWFLAWSPFLLARARLVWPELIALAGVAGWSLAGPTFVVLLLVVLGVTGRLLLTGQWLRRLLHRQAPRPSTAGGGSAGG
jgi:hypothetical protein